MTDDRSQTACMMGNVVALPTGFLREVAKIACGHQPSDFAAPPCRSNSGRIVHLRPNHSPDSDPPPEAA